VAEKFYKRPGALVKASNGLFGWLGAHGIGPKKTVQLEVPGRKTGQMRAVAVNLVEFDGQRYLVAPRGNTEWSRNARAAGRAVIRRGKPEEVSLTEVPVAERAPIIQKYLRENAIVTRREFGVDPKAPLEVFEGIAEKHPVFRITPRT
jgi:deazaflavin-dependent oxidoreductase (nitroreductase family)